MTYMDSDVIRSEIDRTTDDINRKLLILAHRTRRAKDDARYWVLFAIAGGTLCAALTTGVLALIVRRRRYHDRVERHRIEDNELAPALRLNSVGMTRSSAQARSSP